MTSPQAVPEGQGRFCWWKTILESANSCRAYSPASDTSSLSAHRGGNAAVESYTEQIDLMVK
jgi:hypothetical protein